MLKKSIKIILILMILTFTLSLLLISPINRKPLSERDFYNTMRNYMDSLEIKSYHSESQLKAGWHRKNIIPDFEVPMAGYRLRKNFDQIHDTLFVHVLMLDNGLVRVAFISYDLLITPPLLKQRIEQSITNRIPEIDFVYFSATHTHNGIGGWDNSLGGQLMSGKYNEAILDHLEKMTFKCLEQAYTNMGDAYLKYFEVNAEKYVRNRIDPSSAEDGMIRGIEVEQQSGQKAILTTYSAHATNIPAKSRYISGDYPAQLNKSLEQSGYDFAMFMAGAVGSHRLDTSEPKSLELAKTTGVELSKLISHTKTTTLPDSITIAFKEIDIELGESQLRISDNFHLRNWAFNAVFQPLKGEIKYLEIDNLLFLGMPCDFSGEILIKNDLYKLAEKLNKKLIVTSFNGNYIGYITEDGHYDNSNNSEVREMNWVGPYYGKYFSEIITLILEK